MGITNFNSWLRNNYPECFYKNNSFNKSIEYRNYDCIYIDLNFILHNVIHISNNQKTFLTNLYNKLDNILNINFALKHIIIAIDGPGPYSKINLQRKRRRQVSYCYDSLTMNSLLLTPGTIFMNNLDDRIKEYIETRKRRYKFRKVEFTLLSSREPDEGEIKLLRKLYKLGVNNSEYTHLIVGNDADLVVMTSAICINNISILFKDIKGYILFSLDKFIYMHSIRYMKMKDRYEMYINKRFIKKDFSLLSIMMGNDYLPKLYYAKFDTLWNAYKKTKKNTDMFLTIGNNINMVFFKSFLKNFIELLPSNLKKTTYDKKNIQNYLSGLLWCIDMYSSGICGMYDFQIEYNYKPSPIDILKFIECSNIDLTIPKSIIKPLIPEVCGVILLPKKAIKLLPNKIQNIALNKLSKFYEIEECKICNNIKKKISLYSKKIYELKNNDDYDKYTIEQIREKLKLKIQYRDKHSKKHKILNIKEVRKIVEKNLN